MNEEKLSNLEYGLRYGYEENEAPFSAEEYRRRLDGIRARMADENIDTLIVSYPANMNYISGYKAAWFWEGFPKVWIPASCIAVNVNSDYFVHYDEGEEVLITRTTSVPGAVIRPCNDYLEAGVPEHFTTSSYGSDFRQAENIAKDLKQAGWLDGTVGLEFWSNRPHPAYSRKFSSILESFGAEVVDGSDIVPVVRRIKSDKELEYMRTASMIADIGFDAAVKAMRPGVTELEVFAEANLAMAKAGGENSAITHIIGSGGKSGCLHSLASRRQLKPGDWVNIDICGVFNRYHANIARSISIGEPETDILEFAKKPERIFHALNDAMYPGMKMKELVSLGIDLARSEGIWEDRWWLGGYELGIAFPPDWVGYYIYDEDVALGDDRLEAGFTGNYEFNFYLPRAKGIREIIDTLMVTENEAGFIQKSPVEVAVVEI